MFVTFDSVMVPVTPGADDVRSFKPASPFDIFDLLPPRGTAVFPPQTGVYTAFVNINTLFARDSL